MLQTRVNNLDKLCSLKALYIKHIIIIMSLYYYTGLIVYLTEQSDGDDEVDQDLIWAQLLSFKQAG